jgi:hypothetical protein
MFEPVRVLRFWAVARAQRQGVLACTIFSTTSYSSNRTPTQYTDAVHRAQFFNGSCCKFILVDINAFSNALFEQRPTPAISHCPVFPS